MPRNYLLLALLAAITLTGCATPLTSTQKSELVVYRNKGYEVTEKNPETGKWLGLLPGGGSFYTRNYGLGVVNLLFWPVSILWDPFSGRDGAESINYQATKEAVDEKRTRDIRALDSMLVAKTVTPEAYMLEKTRIERKYAPEM